MQSFNVSDCVFVSFTGVAAFENRSIFIPFVTDLVRISVGAVGVRKLEWLCKLLLWKFYDRRDKRTDG